MDSKDSISNANPTEFNPFSGAEILNVIPTTESQMEIWLSCTLGGDDANRAFNESISLKFNGSLNIKAFEESLVSVIYRHEALHSAFSADGSQMIVFKEMPFLYDYVDISNTEKSEIDAKIGQFVKEDAHFIFDLLNGPLTKFKLIKLSETEYYFIFNAHHIICDGWSLGIILQDLSKYYNAYALNLIPNLEQPSSFSAYALEQASFVKSESYEKNLKYWVDKHIKEIPELNLPFDFIRPLKKTYTSSRIDVILNPSIVSAIKSIGLKEGASMVNTLLAAFELFLSKITGQSDIIVGLPAADQSASGQFNLVGHCVNLLPLKSNINGHLNFLEYLKYRKLEILDAYDHQQFTFGSLLKNLKLNRDPSRIPLLPVVFNVDMEMDQGVSFSNLTYHIISNAKAFRNFEFSLNVWGNDENLQLEWSYNNQLFERGTINKMIDDFEALLVSITQDPKQKIDDLLQRQILNTTIQKGDNTNRSNQLEKSRNYYLQLFSGELPALDFPYDHSKNTNQAILKSKCTKVLDSNIYANLIAFQSTEKISLPLFALSLVDCFIYRYTGESDVIIGFKTSDSKTQAVRTIISSDNSLRTLISQNLIHLAKGDENKGYTIANLLRDLKIQTQRNNNGLFEISLSIEDEISEAPVTDFSEEIIGIQDLHFKFVKQSGDLNLELIYNSSLLESITAERILDHLEGLLNVLLQNIEAPIKTLDYINNSERELLIEKFNQTTCEYSKDETITHLFESQVAKTPDNIALVFEDSKYTYAELNNIANQLGQYIRNTYSIKADDLIGIKLDRSEWLIISLLGVLKSGAAYVPIDPEYPQERIDYLVQNSSCKLVIDSEFLVKFQKESVKYDQSNLTSINKSSDLVYVIYTSGSTGQPKGVMVEHKNLVNYNEWFVNDFKINSTDATILLSSFTFDGVNTSIFGSLLSGGALHVLTNSLIKSPKELAHYIGVNKISFIKITPSHLNLLLSDSESENEFILAQKLRLLIVGGDKINVSDIEKVKKGNNAIQIINHYGPTETTIGAVFNEVINLSPKIPIGKPIANTKVYVLDENKLLSPFGVYGELYIGGAGVSRGYLNNPVLTATKFIENPFHNGERLYKTGDIVKRSYSGEIDFRGRRDFQLKIRGYRVEAGEIEAIINQFSGINNTVVIAKGSEENQSVIAFFVADNVIDKLELRGYVEKKLPSYMVPNLFEQIKEIPLSPSGKINRAVLEKKVINLSQTNLENNYSTKEEAMVSKIWRDLLGIENIDKTANFFELGGHSLIAIRVVIRIENETKIKLPMSALFEFPTIQMLAKQLEKNDNTHKWKSLVPIKTTGDKVPVYIIHGGGLGVMVFHHLSKYLDEQQPIFGLQALGIDGQNEPLDTIEEMASFYISEMLQQNPDGPYALAGHSSGGLIAFEMAQQLKSSGKEVKSLTIFDFNIAEAKRTYQLKEKLERQILYFLPILLFNVKSIFRNPKRTFKYYLLLWKLRLVTLKRRMGINPNSELNPVFVNIDRAIAKNVEAIKKYNASVYNGDLNLFVSTDKVDFQKDAEFLGWRKYIKGKLRIFKVKGDHDEMILPPNVFTFAEMYQQILDSK